MFPDNSTITRDASSQGFSETASLAFYEDDVQKLRNEVSPLKKETIIFLA